MVVRQLLFQLSLLLLISVPLYATDLLGKISIANKEIKSSSMDFTQETSTIFFKTPIVSKGKLYLIRPDKLRWEYIDPAISGFIINGNTGLQWNEKFETKQIESSQLSPILRVIAGQILLWLNLDEESLSINFTITQKDYLSLQLIPIEASMQEFISVITLSFTDLDYLIKEIVIEEKSGGTTVISMQNISVNKPFLVGKFTKP
ncbi:MAG: outer membrane lipoprotein carrier protein LolA [Desulfotalea sp.]